MVYTTAAWARACELARRGVDCAGEENPGRQTAPTRAYSLASDPRYASGGEIL